MRRLIPAPHPPPVAVSSPFSWAAMMIEGQEVEHVERRHRDRARVPSLRQEIEDELGA